MTSDFWVLHTLQGDVIEFDWVPVQQHVPAKIKFSDSKMHIIDMELAKLETIKLSFEGSGFEPGDFLSNLFIRPKKDRSFRPILNLRPLNQAISYHYFKMESLQSTISPMIPNCYMESHDLKDAYYSVPVAEHWQRFLKFRWSARAASCSAALWATVPVATILKTAGWWNKSTFARYYKTPLAGM